MTFKPMLAGKCDETKIRFPVLASPKLDGIRCVIRGGKALTRSLKPIPNATIRAELESDPSLEGFDGELMLADPTATFQDITSAVMSPTADPGEWVFHVFDTCRVARCSWASEMRRTYDDGRVHRACVAGAETPMRVLVVTGSRKVRDIDEAARAALATLVSYANLVVHGAAPGLDSVADREARRQGRPRKPFPALWDGRNGPEGTERNQRMVDYVLTLADVKVVTVGFPGPRSRGTWDMLRRSHKADIPTFMWDGTNVVPYPPGPRGVHFPE